MDKKQLPKARQLRLNVRLSQQEWDKVHKLSSNTTCRSVSEYARKVLSEKPVKVFYRNQSFDDFEEKMNLFLPLLELFGSNFDIMVRKLSALNDVAEIKAALPALLAIHKEFAGNTEIIKHYLEKLSDQCDRK
jgi:hypothetical protein